MKVIVGFALIIFSIISLDFFGINSWLDFGLALFTMFIGVFLVLSSFDKSKVEVGA